MHSSGTHPHKKWFVRLMSPINEVESCCNKIIVSCFHSLAGHRPGVFNFAISCGLDNASRPILFVKLLIFGIVIGFWFFFGIKMVKVSKELVETMVGGKVFVLISQMVLAKLPTHIPMIFQQVSDRRRPVGNNRRRFDFLISPQSFYRNWQSRLIEGGSRWVVLAAA